jgi:thiol-disulfide isomerase/thioredoxin
MIRAIALSLLIAQSAHAADLVRFVRNKISAGDLATPIALIEDHKRTVGVDAEYLDAVAWVARGAELQRRPDLARQLVAELRREIPAEAEETLIAYGAAIEVEGRLIVATDGRGKALRYFEDQLVAAKATSLRSRITKNINLLSLEGQPAPSKDLPLASMRGKPVLLYLFAEWCGDCKASSATLTKVYEKYSPRGLQLLNVTRLYGGSKDKPYTPEAEKAQVDKVWSESYPGLKNTPVIISTDAMVRYGASATPTFALIDRNGIVRLYAPTRLSEAELSRRIEEVLAEK